MSGSASLDAGTDALPGPLADLTLPQLEATQALLIGGIAAMERMQRGGFIASAGLVVDDGDVSLILTAANLEGA